MADTFETVDAAVRNLAGRYCAAVVDFDRSNFGDCWMPDAEWIAKGTTISGRDRIVRLFEKLRGQYSLCVQALLITYYVAVVRALHIDVRAVDLAVIVPISFVIQMVPVSVNGFGVREATF